MLDTKIHLSVPDMGEKEILYIQKAFDTNWIAPFGQNILDFEKAICDFTGAKYALALNSGTAAIHLALILAGVGQGDEVICPSFTFIATANPVVYQGAKPIFVDSEPETWNISPHYLEKAIQNRLKKDKKPKAVLVVHLYGQAAKMRELLQIAQNYEIPLIEDAAEALGASYQGKAVGTFGKTGIFSFNGNKIITTSAGGVLVSDEAELIEKALFLAMQAKDKAVHYQHSEIGYNYRLSNILAGIGLGQMEVLAQRIEKRRANFEFYKNALNESEEITFLDELSGTYSNRWLTCVLLSSYEKRELLRLGLEKANIESRPLWKPLHLQPVFKNCTYYGGNIAENLFQRGLCLPSSSNLSQEDLQRVVQTIKGLLFKS